MPVIVNAGKLDTSAKSPSRDDHPVYTCDSLEQALRQGEIISGLTQYEYDLSTKKVAYSNHDFILVASQDCDLIQDFSIDISECGCSLRNVLVYEALDADKARPLIKGSDIWKRIKQNQDDRYAFLEVTPLRQDLKGKGLPELVIDFKRYFTIPTRQIYEQISNGKAERRCRLFNPYSEHFQKRATFYQNRVALPLNHESVPVDN